MLMSGGAKGGRRVKEIYEASREMTDKTFLISASQCGVDETAETQYRNTEDVVNVVWRFDQYASGIPKKADLSMLWNAS